MEQSSKYQDAALVELDEERKRRDPDPIYFNRQELNALLHIYSMMVGAGEWRDYGISHLRDRAVFSVFRHASEMPIFRIEKVPANARKQGAYAVVSADGRIQKRGSELPQVLKYFDRILRLAQAKREGRIK